MNQKIVYQGQPGSFAFLALQKYLQQKKLEQKKFDLIGCSDFVQIFDLVQESKAEYGIVPIENSLAGSVLSNYDLLREKKVFVTNEVILPVKHNLIGLPGVSLNEITEVYSHPKALEQCTNFIRSQNLVANPFSNTALAVKFVKEKGLKNIAAIASKEAAKNFDLEIIQEEIQDHQLNWTRFLIFTKSELKNIWQRDKNKLSLAYTLDREKPGSLVNSLRIFSDKKLNLTNIEARPIPGKFFEYYFYLDIEFASNLLEDVKHAVQELETISQKVKILGVYEKDVLLV
jgi:chorismate mutase/prephenate dehydratase